MICTRPRLRCHRSAMTDCLSRLDHSATTSANSWPHRTATAFSGRPGQPAQRARPGSAGRRGGDAQAGVIRSDPQTCDVRGRCRQVTLAIMEAQAERPPASAFK